MRGGGGGGAGGGGGGGSHLYGGGRVPPPHPFLRSSSVPEQPFLPAAAAAAVAASDRELNADPFLASSDPFHHSTPPPPPLSRGLNSALGSSSYDATASLLAGNGGARVSHLGKPLFPSGGRPGIGGASWLSSASSPSAYLDHRGRLGRFSRQHSVSSELPTSNYDPFLHRDPLLLRHHHRSASNVIPPTRLQRGLGVGGVGAAGGAGVTGGRVPLTLGQSLQLVTSGDPAGATTSSNSLIAGGVGGVPGRIGIDHPLSISTHPHPHPLLDPSRRKKTVRFNSEEWGRNGTSLLPLGAGGLPLLHRGPPSSAYVPGPPPLPPPGPAPAPAPAPLDPFSAAVDRHLGGVSLPMMTLPDEEQPWMTIEDVRSGRWARWDALRQESQESQTRDSGIETGSCFTSSEDSNRGGGGGGDHVGHSKKVRWRDKRRDEGWSPIGGLRNDWCAHPACAFCYSDFQILT